VHLLPTMLLIGGFGLAFPAIITLAMSAASPEDAGVASGLVNTTQQVGAALGVAVLSTLAASRTSHLLASGRPAAEALTGGYHVAFAVGAALATAALLLAAILLRSGHRPSNAVTSSSRNPGSASTSTSSPGRSRTSSLIGTS
jgi:sugar phosphate permease